MAAKRGIAGRPRVLWIGDQAASLPASSTSIVVHRFCSSGSWLPLMSPICVVELHVMVFVCARTTHACGCGLFVLRKIRYEL